MPVVSMEEIDSHSRGREIERASPQRKLLLSRTAIAAKFEAVVCKAPEYALDMVMAPPVNASPRFTPSPVDPFARFDSTSSTSPSHVIHENLPSPHNAREMQTTNFATQSDFSSTTDCPVSSGSNELPIDDVCCKRVSLEQHLRHSGEDREVTMQSFILERFLPAAKTLAADHDRTNYSVGKPPAMPKFSPIMPVDARPSILDTSANSAIEFLPHHNHGNDNESVDAETLAKSCGFFWTGLRSAMSCTHNVAPLPLRDSVTKKSRAVQSSTRRRSFLKDDLQPKVKTTLMEAVQKQRCEFVPDLRGFTATSPFFKDATPRKSSSFVGGLNDHLVQENAHLNFEQSPCSKCHPNSISHQVPPSVKGCLPCDVASNHQSMQTLRCICPSDDIASSSLYTDTEKASEVSNTNADCHVPEDASKDLNQHPTAALEDEFEFYDALSGFDMLPCAESSNPASQESAKSQDPLLSAQIFFSDMHKMPEDHPLSSKGKEISAFNSDHESHVEFFLKEHMEKEVKERPVALNSALSCGQTSRYNSQHNSSGCAEDASGAYLNSYEKKTFHSRKTSSDLSLPGWPLGITSLQLGILKTLPQETEYAHDTYTANSQFAKTDVDQLMHDGKSPKHLILPYANKADEGTKLGKMSNHKKSMLMEFLSPPVPPAPTTSSWLGRALALKAIKPPYLTTLQQQQNVISVSKKQEFTLPPDERKRVKWEDMVKEGQERCHHHPATKTG